MSFYCFKRPPLVPGVMNTYLLTVPDLLVKVCKACAVALACETLTIDTQILFLNYYRWHRRDHDGARLCAWQRHAHHRHWNIIFELLQMTRERPWWCAAVRLTAARSPQTRKLSACPTADFSTLTKGKTSSYLF